MFRKIFDLDPKEVEAFIINKEQEDRKRGLEPEEYEQWLKDYEVQVRWHPTYDEFYVQIEPNITTKDYDHWYFKDDHELTAGEYFKLAFDHSHYYFREIYGLMTGEPICYSTYGTCRPNSDGYFFIIDKKDIRIAYDKVEDKYYYDDWDFVNQKPFIDPIPEDLIETVKKCIKEFKDDK